MTKNNSFQQVNILGINFDNITRMEAVEEICRMVQTGDKYMICTPNADHLVRALRNKEFKKLIDVANLVVPDGMAVFYASHLLGTPIRQNVTGRLLIPLLAERSDTHNLRFFLLGGFNNEVAAKAAYNLSLKFPDIQVSGYYSPPFMEEFDPDENSKMIRKINSSDANVLLVGLGSPKQEKFIARNLQELNVNVSIGVGISIDTIAGRIKTPPKWMTEIGLEWLYRTVQEPKRLIKRYFLDDPVFFWWVLQQHFGRKFS